jgi:hypothetical protein
MQGPRQDAGLQSKVNMGVRTSTAIYNYAQQQGAATRIVVTGLRKADEVLALSGVDYMIVSQSVCKQLADRATLDGYNDGLAANTAVDDCGIPALTVDAAMKVRAVYPFPMMLYQRLEQLSIALVKELRVCTCRSPSACA